MAKLEQYQQAIETAFNEYAVIPYSLGELVCEAVFDRDRDRYLLITLGRDMGERVHFAVAHIDIVNGKLWIRCDNTEEGVATDLVASELPKQDIVLAFKVKELRQHTEFAVV